MGCCAGANKKGDGSKNQDKEIAPQGKQGNANQGGDPIPQPEPENNMKSKADRINEENQTAKKEYDWSDEQVSAVREVFDKFDKDGSGSINKKELRDCSQECGEDLSKNEINFLMGE